MMSTTIRLRTVVLRLTVIVSCWLRTHHAVLAADIVVQDTDPLILYQPSTSWHSSTDSCSDCLNPGGGLSYHEAIHSAIGRDADDSPSSSAPAGQSPPPTAPSPPPPAPTTQTSPNVETVAKTSANAGRKAPATASTVGNAPDSDAGSEGGHKSPESGSGTGNAESSSPGSSGKSKRSLTTRGFKARDDPDDPGFKDPDVTLSFNFTGYSISVYSTQPLGVAAASSNNTPTNMNLTFSLDSHAMGDFTNVASSSTMEFLQNKAIFSRTDLAQAPHQLVINVGQNSSFIFDYLIYSTNASANSTSSNATPSTSLAGHMPSQSTDPKAKTHDIATFAGAVGGSVGVLGLFSLGLALSILRRRRLAALRDRLDSESLHTEGTDDSPHMEGPTPFVPRFFPDTVIPADPPTYTAATNHNSSTLLAQLSSSVYPDTTRSYADIPPSMPHPLDEDMVLIPPPPPFPIAVASPPVVVAPLPSIPEGAIPISDAILAPVPSHNLDSVGISRSNSDVAPESVPLLQSIILATGDLPPLPPFGSLPPPSSRSSSPASSISYDIHGNPIEDPAREDVSYGRGR